MIITSNRKLESVGDLTAVCSKNVLKFFSDTELCLLSPCNVVAQWCHITIKYSWHDSDILLCTTTSWGQVGSHRKQFSSNVHSVFCTRILHPFFVVSDFAWWRSTYCWNLDIDLFLILWYWDIEWRWRPLKSWDVESSIWRALTAQMIEMRQ